MAAAGNNRFAITCGLLRQYMREHKQHQSQQQTDSPAGSFLPPPPPREATDAEETDDGRTMQLFPTHAGTSQQPPSQKRREEQARTPLTIIYEGRVLVFEDFPADKAKDLMQLAGSSGSTSSPVVPDEKPAATEPPSSFTSDLPIARKASLKRFLQKRKHRITSTDPYQQKETVPGKEAADKPANGASWLAL